MEKNQIIINNGKNYKQMTIEVLETANLAADIGDTNAKIGIKPNLVVAATADGGATTHPEILDGVLTYLQKNSFNNLLVCEGSWVGDRTQVAVKVSGLDKVCEEHNVPFVDLQKDSFSTVDAGEMKISLCDTVLELDYLINLPVLKGHCQTQVTCALKNAKGLMPNSEKRRFHTLGLHKPIAHLNLVLPRQMIVVDNICGDLDFEEGGNPVAMDRILCFKDPVLCDAFACKTMGISTKEVPYIGIAERLGIGSTDIDSAEIILLNDGSSSGNSFPMTRKIKKLAEFADANMACSACYGMLIHALDIMDQSGLLHNRRCKVCIGQGYRGQSGAAIGIGNCTRGCHMNLPGCPPTADEIITFLQENW